MLLFYLLCWLQKSYMNLYRDASKEKLVRLEERNNSHVYHFSIQLQVGVCQIVSWVIQPLSPLSWFCRSHTNRYEYDIKRTVYISMTRTTQVLDILLYEIILEAPPQVFYVVRVTLGCQQDQFGSFSFYFCIAFRCSFPQFGDQEKTNF